MGCLVLVRSEVIAIFVEPQSQMHDHANDPRNLSPVILTAVRRPNLIPEMSLNVIYEKIFHEVQIRKPRMIPRHKFAPMLLAAFETVNDR